ncbi:MAG: hypothetical protein B7733_05280 [Myxococcales bacterium FL481]|nr:MAG: hypothetical protein B7733_05280 [Myxococcales bacterium FL481]
MRPVSASLPVTAEQASARLAAASIPAAVLQVGRTLHQAGHQAALVGGAVRDCLRGVPHADWDLATSATPQEVMDLFARTIPTGLAHGTVTVLVGRGKQREAIEVTTFRGDGAYADGRRPDSVEFLRELDEDLARRDFTINALAWDPFTRRFVDRFGGLEDLQRGVVRAVGDPLTRFREDGLRTMRAVRFCGVLGFVLDPPTERAIGEALDVFDKVSRERVRVELFKLLGAGPVRGGLEPMRRTGLWPKVLTTLPEADVTAAIAAVERLPPDPVLRLARLLWPGRSDRPAVEAALDNLRMSRADRRRCERLLEPELERLRHERDAAELRGIVARLGRDQRDDALAVVEADAEQRELVATACEGAVLDVQGLAVGARELIMALGITPGPIVGEVLRHLLKFVVVDPSRNHAPELLAEGARFVAAQLHPSD